MTWHQMLKRDSLCAFLFRSQNCFAPFAVISGFLTDCFHGVLTVYLSQQMKCVCGGKIVSYRVQVEKGGLCSDLSLVHRIVLKMISNMKNLYLVVSHSFKIFFLSLFVKHCFFVHDSFSFEAHKQTHCLSIHPPHTEMKHHNHCSCFWSVYKQFNSLQLFQLFNLKFFRQ